MENEGMKYEFEAKAYNSSEEEVCCWVLVSMPKELSKEIRGNFKFLEEGWGRMKVTVKVGNSEWKTSIWFDTKQDTYLLSLKSEIRKKENIVLGENIKIIVII